MRRSCKQLIASFMCFNVVVCVPVSYAQEAAAQPNHYGGQKSSSKVEQFFKYAWGVVSAPFLVAAKYPRSEETNLYESYLTQVNRNTGRNWKKSELTTRKNKTEESKESVDDTMPNAPAT